MDDHPEIINTKGKVEKDLETILKETRKRALGAAFSNAPLSDELNTRKASDPSKLSNIRTYQNDAQAEIQNKNASLARIKIAKDKNERYLNSKNSSSIFWIILIVLIIAGIGGAGYVFFTRTPKEKPAVIETPVVALINYDAIIKTPLQDILQSRENVENGITYLYPQTDNQDITAKVFLDSLEITPPDILYRNLDDVFMFGTDKTSLYTNSFLILKTNYNYALPGMNEWEENIYESFSHIFSEATTDNFLDSYLENGTLREGSTLSYAVLGTGYIVISSSAETTRKIARELSQRN